MGDIADMMLDGTMCAGCGEWLHDGEDGDGFPGYCEACQPDFTSTRRERAHKPRAKNVPCPHCNKSFSSAYALGMHAAAKHP